MPDKRCAMHLSLSRANREPSITTRRALQSKHEQESIRTTCSTQRLVFFFFQAEDGIRDLTVTGVQTCALPIYALQVEESQVGLASAAVVGVRTADHRLIEIHTGRGIARRVDAADDVLLVAGSDRKSVV